MTLEANGDLHDNARPRRGQTIAQLGHHPGQHVEVNLEGTIVGRVHRETEHWVRATMVGLAEGADFLIVKLDAPLGARGRQGLLGRASRGQDKIWIDDPSRLRAVELNDVHPDGVPEEIVQLVHAGKTLQAIKRYRALNGATVDEARIALAQL